MAAVPSEQDTQCVASIAAANSASNFSTKGPLTNADCSMTAAMAESISAFMLRYWAWRSAKGTVVIVMELSQLCGVGTCRIRQGFQKPRRVTRINPGSIDRAGHHGAGANHG